MSQVSVLFHRDVGVKGFFALIPSFLAVLLAACAAGGAEIQDLKLSDESATLRIEPSVLKDHGEFFGEPPQPLKHTFRVTNQSPSRLEIGVRSSCSCLTVSASNSSIEAGESIDVHTTLNVNGQWEPGGVVYILDQENPKAEPLGMMVVTAIVWPGLVVTPGMIHLTGSPGEVQTMEIRVMIPPEADGNASPITAADSTLPYIDLSFLSSRVLPVFRSKWSENDVLAGKRPEPVRIELSEETYTLKACLPDESQRSQSAVTFVSESGRKVVLPLEVVVQSPVRANKASIFFGFTRYPTARTVLLTPPQGQRIEVTSVQVQPDGLLHTSVAYQPEGKVEVRMMMAGDIKERGRFTGEVRIHFAGEFAPFPVLLPFSGTIAPDYTPSSSESLDDGDAR